MKAVSHLQHRRVSHGYHDARSVAQRPIGVDKVIRRLASLLEVSAEELKDFARLTGNDDVHELAITDLCTTNA